MQKTEDFFLLIAAE